MLSNAIEKQFPDGTYQFLYASRLSGGSTRPKSGEEEEVYTEPDKEASRRASVSRAVSTVFDLARSNDWDLMCTWTFDPKKVDSFDYNAVVDAVKTYNRRLHRLGTPYIQVPELHESGRIHLHGVVSDPDGLLELIPSSNYYTGEFVVDDAGRPLFDIQNWPYGWAKASFVDQQAQSGMVVVKYIMKYMNKALDWVPEGKKRYFASQGLNRPVKNSLLCSLDNDIIDDISKLADYRRVISTPAGPYVVLEIHGEGGQEADLKVNKIKKLLHPTT